MAEIGHEFHIKDLMIFERIASDLLDAKRLDIFKVLDMVEGFLKRRERDFKEDEISEFFIKIEEIDLFMIWKNDTIKRDVKSIDRIEKEAKIIDFEQKIIKIRIQAITKIDMEIFEGF